MVTASDKERRPANGTKPANGDPFELMPSGYFQTDCLGVIRDVNRTATLMLQTKKEFLVGKPLPFLVVEPERKRVYQVLCQLQLAFQPIRDWELRLARRQGRPLDVAASVTGSTDAAGRLDTLHWFFRDISLAKAAEQAISAERGLADALLDAAPVIVLLVDWAGRILRCNPYLGTVSGYNTDDILGQEWWNTIVPKPKRDEVRVWMTRALAQHDFQPRPFPLESRDGRLRTIEWSPRPLASRPGSAVTALLVGHDITDLQEAQEQALQQERLATIGQMSIILAHEGRNALQRGSGCLERLHWKLGDHPDALALVDRAQDALRDLAHLFEDVRTYATPVRLESQPCRLDEVWQDAWAQLAPAREGRDARLTIDCPLVDLICEADYPRLTQVFRNLFENALEACPDPVQVTITATETAEHGRSVVRIVVRDNGPGIKAAQRQHLFEPFRTTKLKGTGLGLAICRRIIEAHGGRIFLGESAGPGAQFILTLPPPRSPQFPRSK
jgi:PAS domain S-box-containing protein